MLEPIKQKNRYYCGPACVQYVSRSIKNNKLCQDYFAKLMRTNSKIGTTVENLYYGCSSFAESKPVKIEFFTLLLASLVNWYVIMLIKHENEDHWIVITKADSEGNIVYMDPYYRLIAISNWYDLDLNTELSKCGYNAVLVRK